MNFSDEIQAAISKLTDNEWHEMGNDIKKCQYPAFLVYNERGGVRVYSMSPPPDVYLLGIKFPRSVMGISELVPKEVCDILEQYFPLN